MKKIKFTLTVLIALSINAMAQIPNYDFENWATIITPMPQGWTVYGKVTRDTISFSGNYAIRLERDSALTDEPGAVLYGTSGQNGIKGGIPFVARPDSLVGFFKYDIKTGDTAWIICILKSKGIPISSDTVFITGDTSAFERIAYKINYLTTDTADTLILGIISTSPYGHILGSYLIADSLHFTGFADTIPNGDFETWVNDTIEDPVGWYTSNMYFKSQPKKPITKSTDSHSGTYAARIENVITVTGPVTGYISSCQLANGNLKPGFPVIEKESFLEGYYKFFPQNGELMTIGVIMYKKGTQVGWGFLQSDTLKSSYTHFITPINYYGYTGTPDSALIVLLPSAGGSTPKGNSVLFVDSLAFNHTLKYNQTITFDALPNKHVGDDAFGLTGYSSSGLDLTYTSSNIDVAYIGGSNVTIEAAGSADITASQFGNEQYYAATPVTRTLVVLPSTGINEVFGDIPTIYPNPGSDVMYIQAGKMINNISVYDLQGRIINQYQPNSIVGKIDISRLSSGLYLIKIQCGDKEFFGKVVKN